MTNYFPAFTKFDRPEYSFYQPVWQHNGRVIDKIENEKGRFYYVDGLPLPSVTTVLGKTKTEYDKNVIKEWQERVGLEEAEKIKNDASVRGDFTHKICEDFILNKPIPELTGNNFHLFRQVYPIISKRITNIHLLESTLFSKKLKIAGRVDCVAEFDGKLSVIDFKTARAEREDYMIGGYFVQETIYGIMFSEMYKLPIKQIVTIMAIDNSPFRKEAQVFVKSPLTYLEQAVTKVRQYYKELEK